MNVYPYTVYLALTWCACHFAIIIHPKAIQVGFDSGEILDCSSPQQERWIKLKQSNVMQRRLLDPLKSDLGRIPGETPGWLHALCTGNITPYSVSYVLLVLL